MNVSKNKNKKICLAIGISASFLFAFHPGNPAIAFDKSSHIKVQSPRGITLAKLSLPTSLEGNPAFTRIAAGTKTDISAESQTGTGLGAKAFVDDMADRALYFLRDDTMSQDEKRRAFKTLLEDSFDMKTIGRFSLGRYWNVSTSQQKDEYLRLFQDMIVNVYAERFSEYKGQEFKTVNYREDGPKDTIVSSMIVSDNGPDVQVDWRIRYKNGGYKVVDVVVEGVSMSITQRSDFAAVIERGGGNISILLDHLRAQ